MDGDRSRLSFRSQPLWKGIVVVRFPALLVASLAALAGCGEGTGLPPPVGSAFRLLPVTLNGPAVDVTLDGRTAISGLSFGVLSRAIALSPGLHDLVLQPANGAASTWTLATASGVDYTAFVIDSAATPDPIVVDDAAAVPAAGMGVLRVASYAALAPAIDVWRSQPDSTGLLLVGVPFAVRAVSHYFASTPGNWSVVVSHHGRTDTLLVTAAIAVAAGEARTVVLLDSAAGHVTWRLVPDRN